MIVQTIANIFALIARLACLMRIAADSCCFEIPAILYKFAQFFVARSHLEILILYMLQLAKKHISIKDMGNV